MTVATKTTCKCPVCQPTAAFVDGVHYCREGREFAAISGGVIIGIANHNRTANEILIGHQVKVARRALSTGTLDNDQALIEALAAEADLEAEVEAAVISLSGPEDNDAAYDAFIDGLERDETDRLDQLEAEREIEQADRDGTPVQEMAVAAAGASAVVAPLIAAYGTEEYSDGDEHTPSTAHEPWMDTPLQQEGRTDADDLAEFGDEPPLSPETQAFINRYGKDACPYLDYDADPATAFLIGEERRAGVPEAQVSRTPVSDLIEARAEVCGELLDRVFGPSTARHAA